MVIGVKEAAKHKGISIISGCAVIVCTLFLNFYLDVLPIRNDISSGQVMLYYKAQVSTAKVVCLVSGGCLLVTSVIMLFFYIKYYIDTHKKELGILKALGYSNQKIARHFWVFGINILMGTAVGFGGAFILMPKFYGLQNKDQILPGITMHFHPLVLLCFVIVPTAAFSLLAVFYACHKLKMPVLLLMRGENTLRSKKTLVFFIIFASFCFSSMTQMSFSMKDLSSAMMGLMILLIGIVLACVTLFIAITTVIKGNIKTIAMMRVSGYTQKECCKTLLGRYRPLSYIGFILGTVYQYVLLRIMVDIVFQDIGEVPAYKFDFPIMILSLVCFVAIYEGIMYRYTQKIRKISVREIMSE